jgi:subtilase family serine protease
VLVVPAALTGCGLSQPVAENTPQSNPPAGPITFYLALPTHASSLVDAALDAAMPDSPHYRRFSSIAHLAAEYGASSATTRAVVHDVEKFGLHVAIDPSRLFARVNGSTAQWASART